MSYGRCFRLAVLVWIGALAACGRVDDRPADRLTSGFCVPDSLDMGGGDTLTAVSQRAIYDAVLDSLRNLYGTTALYLDPRVETVGRDVEFTRLHEDALLDHLMASERFVQPCQADDDSRCDVDSSGVNVRFSGLMRVKGTDSVLVDVTQQTVRPVRDSSDWYFWASWVRFWVEREGRCWRVASSEVKGTV
jgi:hypothetical protein